MPRGLALAAALLVTAFCARAPVDDASALFRDGRWFELRDAVTEQSPPLLRAAVATAFNRNDVAEDLLWTIVQSEPDAADDAYELLCRIYRRTGRYARLAATHAEWAAAFPDSPGVLRWADDRPMFSRPDQINGTRTPFTFEHDGQGYPAIPVTINGIADDFLLDTGAWQSAVTEREALKLGLTVREDAATLSDASGTATTFRTAVADEVVVGGMRFQNVSFAVIAPGGVFEDAELGVIGMPILLAIGTIEWSTDGTAELAGPAPSSPEQAGPNLAFDRTRLLLSAGVLGQRVRTILDTGSNATALNANFAETFQQFVQREGNRGTETLGGIGGSQTFEAIELPELVFTIGATEVALRPVSVTLQQLEIIGGECCVGNAGHDLLLQGDGFSIDFSSMELTVR